MKMQVSLVLKNFFSKGHDRSLKAKKNIVFTFLIKGGSILIGLTMVPLTIHYVNPLEYGIWLTLSSIIAWFSFFDIGFGNGLKNRLAEAIARGDYKLGKSYVSTTYAMLLIIVSLLIVIFALINPFLNWVQILNAPQSLGQTLNKLVLVVFIFFCVQFVFQLLDIIMIAYQKTALASLLVLIGNAISLLIVFVLTKTTGGSLLYLGAAVSISPVVVFFVASLIFFQGKFKNIAPSFKSVNFSYAKDLMGLGVKFFVIQIAVIVLYQTSNLLIAHFFGPDQVTTYNIAYRYFGVINMVFAIIMGPFWPAFTDAWTKQELGWIRGTISKLIKLWGVMAAGGIFMLLISRQVFLWWVGPSVKYDLALSIAMCLYFVLSTFGSIFVYFLNGSGKIHVQFIISIISPIVFIPLAFAFSKWIGGPSGIITASIVCNIYGIFIAPYQYNLIINGKAKGIWNK